MPRVPASRNPLPVCLVPPNGRWDLGADRRCVHVHDAGVDAVDELQRGVDVARVDRGRQPVLGCVDDLDGLVARLPPRSPTAPGRRPLRGRSCGRVAHPSAPSARRTRRPRSRRPRRTCPPVTSVAPSATARSIIPMMRSAERRSITGPTSVVATVGSPSTSASARFATRSTSCGRDVRGAPRARDVEVQRWPDVPNAPNERAVDDEVEVGVVEDDHRVLAAELERHQAGARLHRARRPRAGRWAPSP